MLPTTSRDIDRGVLAEQVKQYVRDSQEEPVYVRNLMDQFGESPEEKDSVRSLVWAMISRKDLILGDSLTLSLGN